VLSVGEEAWVLGGFDDGLQVSDGIWILDGGGWREGPPLPEPLHHLNAAVVDGQVYILGALVGLGFDPIDRSWRLDAGGWTPLPPVPEPLGASAVGVVGTEIRLAGGLATGTEQLAFAFDTVGESWRTLPALPEARDHGVGAGGDAFRVLGGRDNGLANVRDDVFELVGDAWVRRTAMPTARAGVAGTQLPDGRVFVAGGEGNPDDPDGVFAEVELYDPDADTWVALDDLPTPRHGTGAAAFDGGVLVPGGATVQAFRAVDTVEWLKLER
jgi:hypothetical protein